VAEKEPLDRLKRRIYVIILLVGLVGMVLALLLGELTDTASSFGRGSLMTATVFTTAMIWLIRFRELSTRVAEESLYAVFGVIFLFVLFYSMYLHEPPALVHLALIITYLWMSVFYVLVFMMYESRSALLRSALFFVLVFFISLPYALSTLGSDSPFEGFNSLGQLYLSNAVLIVLLFFLSRLKDELRETWVLAEHMASLAHTDPLTGVLNRRGLEAVLEQEMERAGRYGEPLSLIFFDLDNFKQVNDSLGHDFGDSVLIQISRLVESRLRASDQLGRWGGDECIIVAPETSQASAQQFANRLRTAIEDRHLGQAGHLSASFGVAAFRPGDSSAILIKRADIALYRAKTQGKNRVESGAEPV
jgi:diguanylate cyclase (GGDEF)-like protein